MRALLSFIVFSAALLFSTACPRADQSPPNSATSIQSSQTAAVQIPRVPALAPAGADSRYLTTLDGWHVAAWYWAPKTDKAPGVILVHMRGKDKSTWGTLPDKLVDEGYAVIAIDLRGHGETLNPQGQKVLLNSLTEADYQAMLNDIAAAHAALAAEQNVDGERVAIIGASIGANLGIMYAAGDRRVRTVVALSPGLDYFGLKPADYLEGYDARALYLIASEGDTTAFESCQALEKLTTADPVSFRKFEGKDHGTDLLKNHAGLDNTIISGWLLNHLPPVR
ncbi:alpha/beta fold hydrolase [bacterium]|nr:alpha/beta fold hydrolase [bacterium]